MNDLMTIAVATAHLETTGGKVWSASEDLLRYLVSELPLEPLTIVELGSGCGMLGLSLAERRPDCTVVLTEREFSGGLGHLEANFRLNYHLVPNARVMSLDWADSAQVDAVGRYLETSDKPVVIIGSELVYNRVTCDLLVDVLKSLLFFTQTFYYAHSLNRFAMIDIEFFTKLNALGLTVKPVNKPTRNVVDIIDSLVQTSLFEDLEVEIFIITQAHISTRLQKTK